MSMHFVFIMCYENERIYFNKIAMRDQYKNTKILQLTDSTADLTAGFV